MQSEEHYPDLNDLLNALRFEGIPIGVHQVVWLQHAFSLGPTLDRERLKDLLACTLIKQPAQREAFETLFTEWYRLAEAKTRIEQPTPEPTPVSPEVPHPSPAPVPSTPPSPNDRKDSTAPQPPQKSQRQRRLWILVVLILSLGTLSYPTVSPYITEVLKSLFPSEEAKKDVDPDKPPPPPPPPPPARQGELPTEPVGHYSTWVPTFTVPKPPLVDPLWLALGLSLLALANGGFLWWRYERRRTLPEPEEPPGAGPQWLPLLEQQAVNPELLQREELQTAVWGVEHFISEDETTAVDIDRTVAATANAGGLPNIRFEPATYPREVWLWRDTMVQDPTVDRLIDELENRLSLAGLPVRIGIFVNTPDLVQWREGQEFSPFVVEGHRQSALVIILTDGFGIALAMESDLEKDALSNLFRAFGEWPRLTFVQLGNGEHGLTRHLSKAGLACITVEGIPTFLGAGPTQPARPRAKDSALVGDLHAWAAATALSPEPVTDEDAYAIRNALELSLPAWQFRDLCHATGSYYGRLDWSPDQRVDLLNWLAQCSVTDGKIAKKSLLDRAIAYWLERYRTDSNQREQNQSVLLPWKRTPAEQRERMEMAFLELWRTPRQAIPALYQLKEHLGSEIRERLSGLADWSSRQDQSGLVRLPWQTTKLPTRLQWMLSELGFSRDQTQPPKELKPPPRLWLALGLSAGLALSAFSWGAWHIVGPNTPVLDPLLLPPFPVIQAFQQSTLGEYQLTIGTPKDLQVKTTVPALSTIPVEWTWDPQQNVQQFGNSNSQLWHAGTLAQPIRGCEDNWPARSLFVIHADPAKNTAARQLAIQLLDKGSADLVLLGTDWLEHIGSLIQDGDFLAEDQQLIIVAPSGVSVRPLNFPGAFGVVRATALDALAKRLDSFSGVRPLAKIWPKPEGSGQLMLRSGPEQKTDKETGITFVQVCGGTFTMGSDKEKDKNADDDEIPDHSVTLSPFEISTTEVTNGQYQQFQKGHKGEEKLPATRVSWNEAKAFCQNYGYELPTEAEWEYAARGGSTTRWSFGDEEGQSGDYAWFGDNSKRQAHPVRTKLPNPLGLYDMHGNVWEWVEDCYDADTYKNRSSSITNSITNPLVDSGVVSSCDTRVLRGGSFVFEAENLRSASRFRYQPVNRNEFSGFRCVRRPRRQPRASGAVTSRTTSPGPAEPLRPTPPAKGQRSRYGIPHQGMNPLAT